MDMSGGIKYMMITWAWYIVVNGSEQFQLHTNTFIIPVTTNLVIILLTATGNNMKTK